MKTALAIVLALTAVALVGCASPRGGSMASEEGFRVSVPVLPTQVEQGDRKTVSVYLIRDKYFKQEVTVASTTTNGISVSPSKVTVKPDQSPEVLLQIIVEKDAPLGDYMVHVVATPETGIATSKDFPVKVVAP